MRYMLAKFAGKCHLCGQKYAEGDPIHYNRKAAKGAKATHAACMDGSRKQQTAPLDPNAPTGPAGECPHNPQLSGSPNNLLARFDSVAHFCDWTRAYPLADEDHRREYKADMLGMTKTFSSDPLFWFGASSHAECMRLIADGWPEGAARIQEIRDALAVETPRNVRRMRVRSDQGDSFDLHRAYAGQLDRAWDRTQRAQRSGSRHVTLIASMQGLSGTPAWVYFARGAAVLAVADVLGEAGYDVAIEAEYRVIGYRKPSDQSWVSIRIPVKEFRAPADLPSLAATVALAGFKRTYGFAALMGLAETQGSTRRPGWSSQSVLARAPGEFAGFDSFDSNHGQGSTPHRIRESQAIETAQAAARRIIRAIEDGSDGATIWPATTDHASDDYRALSHRMDWTGGEAQTEGDPIDLPKMAA